MAETLKSSASGPEYVLYVDESSDSAEASRLLREAQLPYRMRDAVGEHNLPWLTVGNSTFKTLSGVEGVVKVIAPEAFERYLVDSPVSVYISR